LLTFPSKFVESKCKVIFPFLPGIIGSFVKSGAVHPHPGFTSEITKDLFLYW
jgi:hypothetical protein